jgi:hypothetical protein
MRHPDIQKSPEYYTTRKMMQKYQNLAIPILQSKYLGDIL